MAFPNYPLAANKSNLTPQVTDHFAHHNALAAACNNLQTQADAAVTSARIADGSIDSTAIADGAITYAKLAANAIPPSRVTATGSAFTGITGKVTVCSLVLPAQPVAGEWLITYYLVFGINSIAGGNYFASTLEDGSGGYLSVTDFEVSGEREPHSGMVFYPIAASTSKTITLTAQRFFGGTSTADVYASFNTNRIEAKFWPT